jgi:hypothetical protein
MKVLDLFAGLRGWSDPFKERGHEVLTLDFDETFTPDFCADILVWDSGALPWQPDIILASPPCTAFSVMQIGRNWTRDHQPKNDRARLGLEILDVTLRVIAVIAPRFWIIENPVGKMRKMTQVQDFDRVTVHYCQYGECRMKPTDLFGGFPPSWIPRPRCGNGAPCHRRSPRGSRNGTQGMASANAAKVPRALALAICEAAERDLFVVGQ